MVGQFGWGLTLDYALVGFRGWRGGDALGMSRSSLFPIFTSQGAPPKTFEVAGPIGSSFFEVRFASAALLATSETFNL